MIDPQDQQIVDDVAAEGFHGLHVTAGPRTEPFAYSIGFWETLKAPEVIIMGLEHPLMASMLKEMFRRLKAGAELADGARWPDLLEGFDCISRPVHESQLPEFLGFALWYKRYRTGVPGGIQAYQLFWPGAHDGRFSWEKGCHPAVRKAQTPLYLPHARGLA